jgi:hypothetical protein
MSAISQIEKEIREAVVFLRKNSQTIPSATIQFMKDASIEKLKQGQTLPINSVSDCNMQGFMEHYQNSKHTFTDKAIDVLKSYKR